MEHRKKSGGGGGGGGYLGGGCGMHIARFNRLSSLSPRRKLTAALAPAAAALFQAARIALTRPGAKERAELLLEKKSGGRTRVSSVTISDFGNF